MEWIFWLLIAIGVIVVLAFVFRSVIATVLAAAVILLVFLFFFPPPFVWWDSPIDDDSVDVVTTTGNSLTEERIREIVREEVDRASGQLQMSFAQLDEAVDNLVEEVKTRNLTENELRQIVRSELAEMGNAVQRQNSSSTSSESNGGCRIIHESLVDQEMDHVSSSGSHIHLEYWVPGQPERETLLPTAGVPGGRWDIPTGHRGWVWEYTNCTDEEVAKQIEGHIKRRIDGGFNNAGYVPWDRSPAKPHSGNPKVPEVTIGSSGPTSTSQQGSAQPASAATAVAAPAASQQQSVQTQSYTAPAPAPAAPAPPPAPDCTSTGGRKDPAVGVSWDLPAGGWIVVNIWSNQNDPNLPSRKMFLGPSDQRSFVGGGGDFTQWPDTCQHAAQQGFDNNGNPPISVDGYNAYAAGGSAPAQPAAPAAGDCTGVEQPAFERTGPDSVWTINGPAAAVVWNPEVNGGAEHKIIVPEGETKTLKGYGGKAWRFPSGCEPN